MGWWNGGGAGGGGGNDVDFDFEKNIDIDIDLNVDLDFDIDLDKDVDIDVDIDVNPHIDGNTTSFTIEAEALGQDTFVEVDVVANSIEDELSSLTIVGTVVADG
jgi:hypothetical protein